jgi:hypothetical protein
MTSSWLLSLVHEEALIAAARAEERAATLADLVAELKA